MTDEIFEAWLKEVRAFWDSIVDPSEVLRLDNAITSPSSAARCAICLKMDDYDLMFPFRFEAGGIMTTRRAHIGCLG